MNRPRYPSDVTEAQWELIQPLIPAAKPGGRRREVNMREIINGIFYLTRTGCSWRMLPHDLPPWSTVHYYYRQWRLDGTWTHIHEILRNLVRKTDGREVSPSAAIIDSQRVKTTEKGGLGAMTQGKRPTDESAISWSIRSG
jgi:putative transposase